MYSLSTCQHERRHLFLLLLFLTHCVYLFDRTPGVGERCVISYDADASDQPNGSAMYQERNDCSTPIRYAI